MAQEPKASDGRAVRVIEVKESVFAANVQRADRLRDDLRERGPYLSTGLAAPAAGRPPDQPPPPQPGQTLPPTAGAVGQAGENV